MSLRPDPRKAARLRRLESRVLTRRGLLTGGVAAGMLALSGPFAQAGEVPALRVAVPPVDPDHPPAWLARLLRRTLTTLAPDGTLRPGAALAWEGGGADWRLWLRDAETVAAVVPELTARGLRCAPVGTDGLAVRLPQADDGWPFRLASPDWALAPGAYRWDGPQRLVATDPVASVRSVDLHPHADASERLASTMSGDADAAVDVEMNGREAQPALVMLASGVVARRDMAPAAAILAPA